mmetsp:Transcript_53912/g.155699  ORF Transcript_53912/g.155699 Transcript_53912/m.155699 type:complete len:381 (-) Transcript_53912:420-1562(-)
MAPLEDLQSRDLAWISDFMTQQMVIMLRPMMDHLQETDASCDYAQRMVQRLSMDVAEVRGDIERTNKYLAILRQGLGMQNEGKLVLQRSIEGTARTAKRLDEQMESVLSVVRGMEESVGQLAQEARSEKGKQEDLTKQVLASVHSLDDLQASVERLTREAHSTKDDLMSNEARMEVLQRELRELRRGQLGVVPKLDDKAARAPPSASGGRAAIAEQAPWPEKKKLTSYVEPIGASKGGDPGFQGPGVLGDSASNHSGSSQQSRRGLNRVGSSSGPGLRLGQDHLEFEVPPMKSGSKVRSGVDGSGPSPQEFCDDASGLNASLGSVTTNEEGSGGGGSKLPLLSSGGGRQGIASRGAADTAPRLRFTATMSKQEARSGQGC